MDNEPSTDPTSDDPSLASPAPTDIDAPTSGIEEPTASAVASARVKSEETLARDRTEVRPSFKAPKDPTKTSRWPSRSVR